MNKTVILLLAKLLNLVISLILNSGLPTSNVGVTHATFKNP